ncbi:MAG: hypothetical protein M1831_001383 [Alyxoria varia]|nr:MAG: hypothetical protein M1831_001383 [Alyxoria varia]
MPLFTSRRSPSPSSTHSTLGVNPSKSAYQPLTLGKTVGFPPTSQLVTSVSRPLSSTELWPLYNFETHVRACDICSQAFFRGDHRHSRHHRSSHSHSSSLKLCHTGADLSRNVTNLLYSRDSAREIYATMDNDMHGARGGYYDAGITRVELPPRYAGVRRLLRAVEDAETPGPAPSKSSHRRRDSTSLDANYLVAPRPASTPERRHSRRMSTTSPPPSSYRAVDHDSSPRRRTSRRSSAYILPEMEYSPEPRPITRRKPTIVDWPADEPDLGGLSINDDEFPASDEAVIGGSIGDRDSRQKLRNSGYVTDVRRPGSSGESLGRSQSYSQSQRKRNSTSSSSMVAEAGSTGRSRRDSRSGRTSLVFF